jgi:asparagine synthase (glutamine-hydrolysing)
MKLREGNGKAIFKKALEPMLPNDVLYRPKMGFAVPLGRWIRGPLRERVRASLLNGPMLETGWFNEPAMRQMVDDHERGVRDYSSAIWTMLMFDAFLRVSLGQAAPAPVAA